jgi:hypothetical protein
LGGEQGEALSLGSDGLEDSEPAPGTTSNSTMLPGSVSAATIKRPAKAVAKRGASVAPKVGLERVVLENEAVAHKSLGDARAALGHASETELRLF